MIYPQGATAVFLLPLLFFPSFPLPAGIPFPRLSRILPVSGTLCVCMPALHSGSRPSLIIPKGFGQPKSSPPFRLASLYYSTHDCHAAGLTPQLLSSLPADAAPVSSAFFTPVSCPKTPAHLADQVSAPSFRLHTAFFRACPGRRLRTGRSLSFFPI